MKSPLKKIIAPNPLSILSALLLSLLLFGSYLLQKTEPNTTFNTFFFNQLIVGLKFSHFSAFVYSFILVLLIAFLLFECNETFSMIRVRTMFPSLLFLFLLTATEFSINLNSGLIGCFFLVVSMWSFLSTYQENQPVKKIFNTFFIISIGSCFFFDLVLFIPVFWIAFSLFRIASLRTFLASIVGFCVPYIIILPILYLQGSFYPFVESIRQQTQIVLLLSLADIDTSQILYGVFLLILFLISFFSFQLQINFDKIKTREIMFFFYLITLTTFVLAFLRLSSFANIYPLLAMMLSFLLGHYFSLNNSRFATFIFFFFICANILFLLYN
jgi:hypothetical protein